MKGKCKGIGRISFIWYPTWCFCVTDRACVQPICCTVQAHRL